MGLEHPVGRLGQLRILDPGVGKAFGDAGIEAGSAGWSTGVPL